MKRVLAVILAVAMIFALSACIKEQTAEKYCFNCGESITKDAAFCEHCGTEVGDKKAESDSSSTNTESTESEPTESNETSTPTHTHSYSKKVTTATCTAKGYTTYTCSCGDTYKDNYTNPAHNYLNYRCAKCGQVDKYAILKSQTLKYGKTEGSTTSLMLSADDDDATKLYVFFQYSSQRDALDVACGFVQDDYIILTLLYIPKNNDGTYEYEFYQYYEGTEETTFNGDIEASSFTAYSPISYENYKGVFAEMEEDWVEQARLALVHIVAEIDTFLTRQNLGFTIKDMGFTSYININNNNKTGDGSPS